MIPKTLHYSWFSVLLSFILTFHFYSSPLQAICRDINNFLLGVKSNAELGNPDKKTSFIVFSSDRFRFVWFRVYKVASLTTKKILMKSVDDLKETRPNFIPIEHKKYFKFAFCRNPWDRIVSCYHHKILTKKLNEFSDCFDKDFEYFVNFIDQQDLKTANPHVRLQTYLIPVKECDFIGRMENFSEDIKYVCDQIGIECTHVPHVHKTDHADYKEYYNKKTYEIIARKYKKDIKTFGYSF